MGSFVVKLYSSTDGRCYSPRPFEKVYTANDLECAARMAREDMAKLHDVVDWWGGYYVVHEQFPENDKTLKTTLAPHANPSMISIAKEVAEELNRSGSRVNTPDDLPGIVLGGKYAVVPDHEGFTIYIAVRIDPEDEDFDFEIALQFEEAGLFSSQPSIRDVLMRRSRGDVRCNALICDDVMITTRGIKVLPEEGFREIEATSDDTPRAAREEWRIDERYGRWILSNREVKEIRDIVS